MIEQRIADRFRTAVLDEPPLGFDPDDVVDRAKRQRRHRRAIGASALTTIGVAMAAVAVFAASGGTPPGGAGSPRTSESVTPPGDPEPSGAPDSPKPPKDSIEPSMAPQVFPGSEDAVKRLTPAISAVLAEKVPGLKFTKPDSDTLMVDSKSRTIGGAYLATGTKHRYVSVFVSHNKDTLDLAGDVAAAGGWGSAKSDTTQPDGSHVRVYAIEDTDGAAALTVVHIRVDGVIVIAGTTAKPEPGRTGLAVSQEVLTAVATDGRLTF